MRLTTRFALLLTAATIDSCTTPPQPAPRPVVVAPTPVPTPTYRPAPLAADWRDWPYTPGDWVYRQDARGSIALFGVPQADALFTIRCDRAARAVYLSRSGTAGGTLTFRTSTLLRTVPAVPTGGVPAYVAAAITQRDPLLEAMGYSRGRFVVQQTGAPTLVLPAWAEILRVTEDCRS